MLAPLLGHQLPRLCQVGAPLPAPLHCSFAPAMGTFTMMVLLAAAPTSGRGAARPLGLQSGGVDDLMLSWHQGEWGLLWDPAPQRCQYSWSLHLKGTEVEGTF